MKSLVIGFIVISNLIGFAYAGEIVTMEGDIGSVNFVNLHNPYTIIYFNDGRLKAFTGICPAVFLTGTGVNTWHRIHFDKVTNEIVKVENLRTSWERDEKGKKK